MQNSLICVSWLIVPPMRLTRRVAGGGPFGEAVNLGSLDEGFLGS